VTHYFDDDSWGFFCGTTNKTEDLKVIAMEEALKSDATLKTIAALPPGWTAWREKVGDPWHKEQSKK
jgi:hypothetical protein